MDTTAAITSNTATQGASVVAESARARATISSDFETFLKMLTAQARYQDPLEPLDSAEYASQLAQFSSVEQQVLTNDLLTGLNAHMGGAGLAQFAGWIGMDAKTDAAVHFKGNPVLVYPNIEPGAEQADLVARDPAGNEVARQAIDPSGAPVLWQGTGPNGLPLGNGHYQLFVDNYEGGVVTETTRAQSYARITEARNEPGGSVLVLDGGETVTSSDVTALREGT